MHWFRGTGWRPPCLPTDVSRLSRPLGCIPTATGFISGLTQGLKRWVQRIRVKGGSLRNLGLGSFPLVGLADAREMALANQRMARAGTDPLIQKQVTRKVIPTFASAARTVIDLRQATWTNKKHASQWANTLRTYAYPTIGSMPVDQITSGDVLAVLTPIWTTKSETATRVRQRIETILDWAIAQGHRVDNPAGKALNRALPKMPRVKAHYRALPYEDVPAALEEVRNSSAQPATRLAFEYLVLTAARSGEVRIAQWSEIDWTSKTWNVPASRMKARRDHRVPLSDSALSVLLAAQRLEAKDTEDTGLIFPGLRGRPLSDMVHTALLRRLGIPRCAPRLPVQLQGLVYRVHRHAVGGR